MSNECIVCPDEIRWFWFYRKDKLYDTCIQATVNIENDLKNWSDSSIFTDEGARLEIIDSNNDHNHRNIISSSSCNVKMHLIKLEDITGIRQHDDSEFNNENLASLLTFKFYH
ncbi:905_t:CDS:2 [Entrophospora sp. SA101]|nr:905_t:CDS:2 [Entrophospora sp. SA101]